MSRIEKTMKAISSLREFYKKTENLRKRFKEKTHKVSKINEGM